VADNSNVIRDFDGNPVGFFHDGRAYIRDDNRFTRDVISVPRYERTPFDGILVSTENSRRWSLTLEFSPDDPKFPLALENYNRMIAGVFARDVTLQKTQHLSDLVKDIANDILSIRFVTTRCFISGTEILLSDGTTKPIEKVYVGDEVGCFSTADTPFEGLIKRRRVTQLYQNITTELVELSFSDSSISPLICTPGHHFLDEYSDFPTIIDMLARGNGVARVVLANGTIANASGRSIKYSAATAHLYEGAEAIRYVSDGGVALQPEVVRGWRTYNFEVEELHTYIAGGVRVHNLSDIARRVDDAMHSPPGSLPSILGDQAVQAMHAADQVIDNLPGGMPRALATAVLGGVISLATGALNATVQLASPWGAFGVFGSIIGGIAGAVAAVSEAGQRAAADQADALAHQSLEARDEPAAARAAAIARAEALRDNSPEARDERATRRNAIDPNGGRDGGGGLSGDRNGAGASGSDSGNGVGGGYNNPGGVDKDYGRPDSKGPGTGGGNSKHNGDSQSGFAGGPVGGSSKHNGDSQSGFAGGPVGGSIAEPVLLDLDGYGLTVDPLSASSHFVDLDGDGYQNRTAWAGRGTGVLVIDADGDGKISRSSEFAFTEWDPTAAGDLEAIKSVFDSNHNGKLDAGDARWSEFKVAVGDQLVSLASLGIASIDLTPSGSGQRFEDGSSIGGTTTYTKSGGGTGFVGNAVLMSDAMDYIVRRSIVTNADGTKKIVVNGYGKDGRLAFQEISQVNAAGTVTDTSFDDDGDGVVDRSRRDELTIVEPGTRRRVVRNLNADGLLADSTTTTSNLNNVVTQLDQDGDGYTDQMQQFNRDAERSITTVTAFSRDGSTLSKVVTTATADGLSKTIQTNSTRQDDRASTDAERRRAPARISRAAGCGSGR